MKKGKHPAPAAKVQQDFQAAKDRFIDIGKVINGEREAREVIVSSTMDILSYTRQFAAKHGITLPPDFEEFSDQVEECSAAFLPEMQKPAPSFPWPTQLSQK